MVVYNMSLDKSIEHRKDLRTPYRGAKAVDRACRNHGSCMWCRGNRLHGNEVRADKAKQQLKDASRGDSGNVDN